MTVIQQDTEFAGCDGNCGQGDQACPHPDRCMWSIERENPWLILVYALVIVASVLVSMLAVTL